MLKVAINKTTIKIMKIENNMSSENDFLFSKVCEFIVGSEIFNAYFRVVIIFVDSDFSVVIE
jgi:hypothetical protein